MQKILIPKKNGTHRLIYVPDNIEKELNKGYIKYLTGLAVKHSKHSHGFMPGKSAVTAAKKHIGYNITICWDLKDFFDSVTPEMVYDYIDLPCLFIDGAPRQGLPTSPLVANLAALKLDNDIAEYIQYLSTIGTKAIYTRYADDLTISFNDEWVSPFLLTLIPEIVKSHGFAVNLKKTRVQFAKAGRRVICGVAVDDNKNYASRNARRKLRAAKHQASLPLRNREQIQAQAKGLEEWCKQTVPLQSVLDVKTKGRGYDTWNILGLDKVSRKRAREIVEKFPIKYYIRASNFINDDSDKKYAAALACVFGADWLNWVKNDVKIHDYCYWLPLNVIPEDGLGKKLFQWRRELEDFISHRHEIEIVCKNWLRLSAQERNQSLSELIKIIQKKKYKNIRHQAFADECAKFGADEKDYKEYEKRWLRALKNQNSQSIPFVDFIEGDYRVYNIAKTNPMGVWIGEYTGCCQHLDGEGDSCAWHSIESPDGSILVIEYRGKIIAQSWIWRNKDVVVADNCEAISNEEELLSLYKIWASKIVNRLCVKEVRIGGRGDINLDFLTRASETIDTPDGCYSDAVLTQKYLIKEK